MGGKYGHGYTGATHITKVFVRRTIILFLLWYIYLLRETCYIKQVVMSMVVACTSCLALYGVWAEVFNRLSVVCPSTWHWKVNVAVIEVHQAQSMVCASFSHWYCRTYSMHSLLSIISTNLLAPHGNYNNYSIEYGRISSIWFIRWKWNC